MMKKFSYFALLVALFTVSCDVEQSSYSIDSITESATIQGTLFYNEGDVRTTVGTSSVVIENNQVPAVGQKVLVSVDYDQYTANASGSMIYEAIVDELGTFSVEIPVVNTVSAKVYCASFSAAHSYSFNNSIVTLDNVLYDVSSSSLVSLSALDIKSVELMAETSETYNSIDIASPVTVKGIIYSRVEELNSTRQLDDSYVYTVYPSAVTSPISGLSANLTFKNTSSTLNDDRTIEYTVTSNSAGEFTCSAYFFSEWEYEDVKVYISYDTSVVTATDSNAFIHYYLKIGDDSKYYTQSLAGYYNSYSTTYSSLSYLMAAGTLSPYLTLTLKFSPLDSQSVIGVYADTDSYVSPNPMNW